MGSFVIGIVALAVLAVGLVIWRKPSIGRKTPPSLLRGQQLAALEFETEAGDSVSIDSLRGTPTVILFVRGNWCPFCSSQVKNMTSHYKEISDLGGRLIIVAPKPLETTRRVAELFEVDFDFWLDPDLQVIREIGLLIDHGVPARNKEAFGDDAVWPAAVVTDKDNRITFVELSRTIMDRPSSDKLLSEMKKNL